MPQYSRPVFWHWSSWAARLTRSICDQRVSPRPTQYRRMLPMCSDASYVADLASIKTAAASLTDDMMSFYGGHRPGGTPGLLPAPYYCEPSMPNWYPTHSSGRAALMHLPRVG